MTRITAVQFQRKFGEFQHLAQREPVEITRHGRRDLVLLSAAHYDRLVAAAHGDAPPDAARHAATADDLVALYPLTKE